jgi:hypothetical protein
VVLDDTDPEDDVLDDGAGEPVVRDVVGDEPDPQPARKRASPAAVAAARITGRLNAYRRSRNS